MFIVGNLEILEIWPSKKKRKITIILSSREKHSISDLSIFIFPSFISSLFHQQIFIKYLDNFLGQRTGCILSSKCLFLNRHYSLEVPVYMVVRFSG